MDLQNKLYWTYIIIYTKLRKFFLSLTPAGQEQLAYEQKKKVPGRYLGTDLRLWIKYKNNPDYNANGK